MRIPVRAKIKYIFLFVLLSMHTSLFAFVDPASPQGKLEPDTQGMHISAGDQVVWKEGHSPYLSVLLQDALQAPAATYEGWYLIGHRLIFAVDGVSPENFQAHEALVKDNYTAKILRLFTVRQGPVFQFDYGNSSFSTFVGEQTPFTVASDQIEKTATWEVINSENVVIKTLKTKIRYQIISYYTRTDLTVNGNVKLNIDQSNISSGQIKFLRLGPGKSNFEQLADINPDGTFTVETLAKGFYKILYSRNGEEFTQTLNSLVNIDGLNQHLDLRLKFQTAYRFQLKYQKQGEDLDIHAMLTWENSLIALPYGVFPQDTDNELTTLPHFIGDFNSNTRLDRDGNQLTVPYADDNVDELIFLSWNDAATNQTLSGNYQTSSCTLKDSRDNRLYFTSTLKETEYGPWILPAKKLYVNWSISYECGPNHGSTMQTLPLVNTPIGSINELGEIQGELSPETLQKIKNRQAFTQSWQFTDLLDQGKVTVLFEAKPL